MLNSEKKLLIKKILPILICRFSNELFELKKCRILHIENLTSNENIGIASLHNEYSADKLDIASIFEI